VSCGPNGTDPNVLTGVAVTPAEVSMVPGDEVRLTVTPVPATAVLNDTVSVTWVSSDTSVVVVNDMGTITAVGYGKANVTATCGEFTGVCAVWVKTYYENLTFTNAFIMNIDTTTFGDEVHEITTSDGSETFNCYLGMAELWLFSDGFYINESGHLDGGQYASYIRVYAPMWYGTQYLNPEKGGVKFSLGTWKLENLPADSVNAHIGTPGTLNEEAYMAYMDAALQYYNAGDGQMFQTYLGLIGGYVKYPAGWPVAIQGPTMTTMEYIVDESGEGGYTYSYIPDGIVTEGQWSLNGDGVSAFMMGMDYNYLKFREIANNADYIWGCNWLFNEDGSEIAWGDEGVMHWGEEVVYQLGELPTAEAPKMEPLHAPVMKIDYPEIAERIEKQLKENAALKVKK
jgi:hypothetical protein